MKVLTNLKGLVMISCFMLIISACGKQTQSILGDSRYNTYGSCNTAATGDNVYTGTIADSSDDQLWNTYGITTGTIKLNVIPVSGTISGQYYASAIMNLNGAQYCCTSQGISGTFGIPMYPSERATVSGLTLSCQTMAGSTGYFSGSYQSIALKIGVVGPGGFEDGSASLRTDHTLRGYITLSSGVQGLGGYSTYLHFVM